MSDEIAGNLSDEEQLQLFRKMLLIRKVEEALGAASHAGELPGPVHLYVGQEAVAVGVCAHLTDPDWIASTHRGHGHFLAKGGDPKLLVAEVFGRENGICKGRGGSMHVADYSRGIIGANGIVGGGIGLTVGAALACQLDGAGRVAVAFFGDGAANQGVLMEALNVGSLWKLPLVLVCENNGFSEFSPTETVTSGSIARRADPFGIPGQVVDGNDLIAVWQAARSAVRRAREGHGPTLLECRTYRLRGHVEYEVTFLSKAYREDAEVERRKNDDPIVRHRKRLGALAGEVAAIEKQVDAEVAAAVAFASEGPWPDAASATRYMFS